MAQEIAPRPSKAPNFEVRHVSVYESEALKNLLLLQGEGHDYPRSFTFGTIWIWHEKPT